MGNRAEVGWFTHLRWFRSVRRARDVEQFIIEGVLGDAIGSGRLDYSTRTPWGWRPWYGNELTSTSTEETRAEVSIIIEPGLRGQGYGAEAIGLLARTARGCGADSVVALVRAGNLPSVSAFHAAGFEDTRSGEAKPGFLLLEYRS